MSWGSGEPQVSLHFENHWNPEIFPIAWVAFIYKMETNNTFKKREREKNQIFTHCISFLCRYAQNSERDPARHANHVPGPWINFLIPRLNVGVVLTYRSENTAFLGRILPNCITITGGLGRWKGVQLQVIYYSKVSGSPWKPQNFETSLDFDANCSDLKMWPRKMERMERSVLLKSHSPCILII